MPQCAVCGQTASQDDRFCRVCGAALELRNEEPQARRGRVQVVAVAGMILGMEITADLFALTVSSFTGFRTSQCLSSLLTLFLEAGLIYLIYRGHGWARWLVGILSLLGVILVVVALPRTTLSSPWVALPILAALAAAASAAILLLSPDVRAFQRAQRSAPRRPLPRSDSTPSRPLK